MAEYASPRSPRNQSSRKPSGTRPRPHFTPDNPNPLARQLPLVSARWLLWSLAAIFGTGLALVYATMCFLFWQGQWQILFHPGHPAQAVLPTPSLPFEDVRFGPNLAGQPQLDGWFIPAPSGGRYAPLTILYLHSMRAASLTSTQPALASIHALGINLFAFDYRGFGASESLRPSEATTATDVAAAWRYLTETRHLAPGSIVLYGSELAANLAGSLAVQYPEAAGLVLDEPTSPALTLLTADPRSRWLPVRLLGHDRFDPASALAASRLPKLFLLTADSPAALEYAQQAAPPKQISHLTRASPEAGKQSALKRFLDEVTPPSSAR